MAADPQQQQGNLPYPPAGMSAPPYPTQAQPAGAPYPPMGMMQPPPYQQQPYYQGQQPSAPPPGQPGYPQQQQYGAFDQGSSNPGLQMAGQQAMMGQAMGAGFRNASDLGGYDSDAEGGNAGAGMGSSFDDKAIRRAFIRKVYGILSVQLAVTVGIICVFMYVEPVKEMAIRSRWMYWVAFALLMVVMIAMACCESVRRNPPQNFIFLGIFTLCQGFMLGCVTAHFEQEAVLIAAGATAAVVFGLTIFALQTKIDFTVCGAGLCVATMILMLFGFFVLIFGGSKITIIIYGSLGALIFSMYLIYDTQLMMGGKHKYSISPEEYVFAALNIYLDIVNLFLYILMIVGASGSD